MWESVTPAVVQAFRDGSIEFAKGVMSGTSGHQAADVSDEFRDLHKGIEAVIKRQQDCTNQVLSLGMNTYWQGFAHFVNSDSSIDDAVILSSPQKIKTLNGLEILTWVMQNGGYCTPDKARQGFVRCGQHIIDKPLYPILGFEDATVDFDRILGKCYRDFSNETIAVIKGHVPELVRICRCNGKLTQKDLVDIGLYQRLVDEGFQIINRDNMVSANSISLFDFIFKL